MTQSQFAEKFDVSVRTLQGWELEDRKVPKHVIGMMERIVELEQETATRRILPLSEQIQSATTRAAESHSIDNVPEKESTPER